jgi:fructose-bisphosphate aldolase class I
LIDTANYIVNPRGKGIYATDETPEGIEARLCAAEGGKVKEYTAEERRERRMKWRANLYETLPSGGSSFYHVSTISMIVAVT